MNVVSDVFELFRAHFTSHGYSTLALALLLENAGVPVPGETVLLFASFLSHEHKELNLWLIIVVGTVACTAGDNLGYWIGYRGGRPLLDRHQAFFHISDGVIERGERLFRQYGSATILFSRFIVGLRVIAGPLAGVLRMPWRTFALWNFVGAATWTVTISSVGYFLGHHWERVLGTVTRINEIVIVGLLLLIIFWLWRSRRFGH